jgi:hypothetical protein
VIYTYSAMSQTWRCERRRGIPGDVMGVFSEEDSGAVDNVVTLVFFGCSRHFLNFLREAGISRDYTFTATSCCSKLNA